MLLPLRHFAQRFPFQNLSVENGLIQSQVSSIAQDGQGNLWIGTIGGLSRYDGHNFTNYNVRSGMDGNNIRTLTIDSRNHIWIGTQNLVSEFNGSSFKHYTLNSPVNNIPDTINELKAGRGDTIWCRTNRKIYFIADGRVYYVKEPADISPITAILPDNNHVWVAKASGILYMYTNGTWNSMMPDTGRKPIILRMYKSRTGTLWLGTNLGVYKVDNNKIVLAYNNQRPLLLPPILAMTEDHDNTLWLGIYSGALHVTAAGVEYYNKHNGLSDNVISDAITDKEGNVWLASDGQGIFRFSGAEFTILDERMGMPSAQVTAFGINKKGGLWIGTYDAGLFILDNGKVTAMPFPNTQKPIITCMYTTNDGKLWIGTRNNGLWEYNNSVFISHNEDYLPSRTISCIYSDSPGRLWIGFANGMAIYQHSSFKTTRLNNLIVYNILPITKDSVLLATTSGIKLYKAGSVTNYITGSPLDNSSIQCILLKGDELWGGTSDNGVIAYNMLTKKYRAFDKQNGFRSDFIYNMVADNAGNIWAGTGYGIHKISQSANGNYSIRFYGKEQGIAGMESNLNAVLKMKDGRIWFGTTNGAVHYRPNSKVISPQPVSIVMESVKLFGQNITDSSYYDSTDNWFAVPYQLHLPHQKNNLSFSFHAITLTGAEQLYYRYIIEGVDATWSNWSTTNSVTYSALPPGNFVFHVQCKTADADTAVRELLYPFEIITPFHKTGLFRLLVLAGCILIGVSIQYIINKRKQNRIRLLDRLRSEEQAKIRLRTAEDFHDEVGNKLTRINVLTNVLQSKLGTVSADTKRIITQIQDNATQLYGGTRDILWSLQPANDSLYEILHRIREFGNELFQDTEVEFNFYGSDENWKNYKLPMDRSRNLIMIFKEALNNCLKYSGAKHVKLEVELHTYHTLSLILTDDGKGFDVLAVKKGQGLDNMAMRAERLGGKLYIDSKDGKGTIITLRFHIRPSK